ncbi:hypothetical protein [Burkholderia cenocepacia]|nr:hypothetical protein [Burkholderia cenocepacia]
MLAALEPDTPTLRPLFGKAVPTLRPGVSTRRAKIGAWRDLTEGADFLVI